MSIEGERPEEGLDMNAAVEDISSHLGFEIGESDTDTEIDVEVDAPALTEEVPDAAAAPDKTEVQPVKRDPPKSWSKDKHALWERLDDEGKDYYTQREKQFLDGLDQYKGDAAYAKELRDVTAPYKAFLTSQGATEKEAVGMLLNAHYRLSSGTMEERQAAYQQIGVELGLVQGSAPPLVDPALKQLRDELNGIKSTLTAAQQAEQSARAAKANTEIEAFASDPANAHFNDVGQDMVRFVKEGMSLKDAYDKAVWANPVTRQKELDRIQTEAAAKLKEKAKTEGNAARRASSTNVRGVESRKAPTEPKGNMDQTMRDTLKSIKERAH